MLLQGEFVVNAPRGLVWERITDPTLMVSCIPGCEGIEELDPTHYKAVVAVSVGVVKARFHLDVHITKEDPPTAIHATTSGQEGTQASMVSADNVVTLSEAGASATRVTYSSDVSISGRLGKYGLGIMRKRANVLSEQFAENFRRELEGDGSNIPSVPQPEKRGLWARLTRGFRGGKPALSTENEQNFSANTPGVVVSNTTVAAPRKPSGMVLRPRSISEAISLLVATEMALPLSGGATLIAMKNANLIEAKAFVSLADIEGLSDISVQSDGRIRIGAMARHRDTAACELLSGTLEVVRQAAQAIANPPVRNMGTIGGSVANADPAADYLGALVCVDAQLELTGPEGQRAMAIADFVTDWYETAIMPAEIITAVFLPAPAPGYSAYRKVARVSGDFATASCALSIADEGPRCVQIAIGGCGPAPLRHPDAEAKLAASNMSAQDIADFAATLVAMSDPVDDVRGSADYRRLLIPRLIADALALAAIGKEAA